MRRVALLDRVRTCTASDHHEFWEESISLADAARFNPTFARGHRQVTDVCLLGLAHAHGGRLATVDRSIPLAAVVGARPGALEVIAPIDDK